MNREPIILVGGGGHCRSVIDVIEEENRFEIFGIVDKTAKVGDTILGYPVIDGSNPKSLQKDCNNFHITVGQIKSSTVRRNLYDEIKEFGGNLPVIKSPHAIVSRHSSIGEGTVIMHQVVINANANIGVANILNTSCLIEHDAIVGNFNHISTKSIVNGNCEVGNDSFLGSNAVLAHGVKIADHVIVAAGSNVYKSLKDSGIYLGFPLRKIR